MTAPVDPVPLNPTGRPIVFYSPHQDDETLFMGKVIAHHVLAGRDVHVVLCSNGSTSAALSEINGTVPSGWWGGWHYPVREGYDPLAADDFGLSRTGEFVAALRQLGVRPENVHFGRADQDITAATSNLLPPNISVAWATDVMTSWASHFTVLGFDQVGHYTMHKLDPMPDHAALGQGLANLKAVHPSWFGDVRWLVKPEQAAQVGATAYVVPTDLEATINVMSRAAGRVYGAWRPDRGSYAIGYHSVTLYFKGVEALGPDYTARLP